MWRCLHREGHRLTPAAARLHTVYITWHVVVVISVLSAGNGSWTGRAGQHAGVYNIQQRNSSDLRGAPFECLSCQVAVWQQERGVCKRLHGVSRRSQKEVHGRAGVSRWAVIVAGQSLPRCLAWNGFDLRVPMLTCRVTKDMLKHMHGHAC
jgi:hypothetical protein